MKNMIKNWSVLLVADGFTSEERIEFARTFVNFLEFFDFRDIVAKEDMPFALIGEVYDKDWFEDGTRIETSPIGMIGRWNGEHCVAVTKSGGEYYIALDDMDRELAMLHSFLADEGNGLLSSV